MSDPAQEHESSDDEDEDEDESHETGSESGSHESTGSDNDNENDDTSSEDGSESGSTEESDNEDDEENSQNDNNKPKPNSKLKSKSKSNNNSQLPQISHNQNNNKIISTTNNSNNKSSQNNIIPNGKKSSRNKPSMEHNSNNSIDDALMDAIQTPKQQTFEMKQQSTEPDDNENTNANANANANENEQGTSEEDDGEENENTETDSATETSSESDESEEDDDHGSESSEEDDTEPQLKYQRLGGGVTEMVKRDSATCLASHAKILVLGMSSGWIYVLDPHGDIIKKYEPHPNYPINGVSIDSNGDYVASCAKDGRVVIRDIFKDVQQIHNFHHQDLLSVELHPQYGTQNMFVTGGRGQQLLLRSIGFFRSDNKVLHSGEGPIYTIKWRNNLIAWANDRGVKLYDITDHKPIAHINRSTKGSPDPERYKCCLCWENNETLLIGWGDWVKIGRIRTVRTPQGHIMKEVHVTSVFITDFFICGIAPFKEHLVLLAFNEGDNDGSSSSEEESDDEKSDSNDNLNQGKSKPPELRIVSRRGQWIATDALPIKGYKRNQASDYKLVWSFDEAHLNALLKNQQNKIYDINNMNNMNINNINMMNMNMNVNINAIHKDETFYIVSPKDIVAALPRTIEDHIKWLWEKKQYEVAWREAVKHSDELVRSKLNPTDLGQEFLKWVLKEDPSSHKKFADYCHDVCLKDKKLWEKWINLLAGKGKLHLIISRVPLNEPRLSSQCYELILHSLIKSTDHRKFLQCIRTWDATIYNMQTILTKATNHLNEIRQSDFLVQALAELYRRNGEYDKALEYYLQLTGQLLVYIPEHFDIVEMLIAEGKQYRNPTLQVMIQEHKLRKQEVEEKEKERESKSNNNNIQNQEKRQKDKSKSEKQKRLIRDELERIQFDVYSMIKMHNLFDHIQDKVLELVELDCKRAIDLFTENVEFIHPTFVVQQVKDKISDLQMKGKNLRHGLLSKPGRLGIHRHHKEKGYGRRKGKIAPLEYKQYLKYFLYKYLHQLVGHGDGTDYPEFHDELVSLYAQFDTTQLLQFLNLSNHVTFPKALLVCQSRLSSTLDETCRTSLYECYVFILHRMGNFSEALQVILIKLKNVRKAVQYVEKQHDKSLWAQLIDRTLEQANQLMPELLDAVKGHPFVNTQDLINKIPNDLNINHLKAKIIAIFEENLREKSLTAGTTNILRSDCMKLAERYANDSRRGISVNNHSKKESCICTICNIPLSVYPSFYRQQEARNVQLVNQQKSRPSQRSSTMKSKLFSGFGRMKQPMNRMLSKDDEIKTPDLVSTTSNNPNNDNQSGTEQNLPLWQLKELSQNLPPIRAFFCGHYYHYDCLKEAIEKDPTMAANENVECVRCAAVYNKK